MKLNELKEISLFSDLSEEELSCDISGETVVFTKGDIMWQEGDEARHFMVVLEGSFQIYRLIKGERLYLTDFHKGMTGGELPLLAGTPHPGNAVALTDVKLFRINEDNFWKMIGECETLRRKILADMAERMQELNLLSFQREKMFSLGTMAAGLAHELNNPASAAKRASQSLIQTLDEFDKHSSAMLNPIMFKDKTIEGFPYQPLLDALQPEGIKLDSLTRSQREDELIDWLDLLNIADAWNMASTYVSLGYTKELLEDFTGRLEQKQVANFLVWLYKDIEMRVLVNELKQSTTRISDLVMAIKSYSYMDQENQKLKVDLHEGLNNTLIILNHKFKKKNIKVVKDYGENIPKITAYGSELNQVWTNLLDNAIDAVTENEGIITIKTYLSHECADTETVVVEIIDNGTGIPQHIQGRIFEPFFTTKEVGKGTGIGLEIVYRIVVQTHKGSVELVSEPGFTQFMVYLPVDL